MATSAPSAARARAMALPIPLLPPVTRATRPSSVIARDSSGRPPSGVGADRRHQPGGRSELGLLDVGRGAEGVRSFGHVLAMAQRRYDDDGGIGCYPADEGQRLPTV